MTANAGRPDYNATIRDPVLHAGEPSFRLRGQDELAIAYQLGRRAWRAAIPANSIDDVLAAQRAADQAKAEDRAASLRARADTCKHAAWTFDAHGRVCPDCGTMMIKGATG